MNRKHVLKTYHVNQLHLQIKIVKILEILKMLKILKKVEIKKNRRKSKKKIVEFNKFHLKLAFYTIGHLKRLYYYNKCNNIFKINFYLLKLASRDQIKSYTLISPRPIRCFGFQQRFDFDQV